jgi:hypothetical protein
LKAFLISSSHFSAISSGVEFQNFSLNFSGSFAYACLATAASASQDQRVIAHQRKCFRGHMYQSPTSITPDVIQSPICCSSVSIPNISFTVFPRASIVVV